MLCLYKAFLLSGERGGFGVGTGCKLVVKHVYAHAVVADERKLVDEGTAVVFFLYLLRYEPLEPVASGVVLFFFRESEGTASIGARITLPPRWLT